MVQELCGLHEGCIFRPWPYMFENRTWDRTEKCVVVLWGEKDDILDEERGMLLIFLKGFFCIISLAPVDIFNNMLRGQIQDRDQSH